MFKLILGIMLITNSLLSFSQTQSGLKKVNYQNETSDKQSPADAESGITTLSAEQAEKLQKDIAAIKLRQAESQKILDQIEKDEE